jgi:hypothetical protein
MSLKETSLSVFSTSISDLLGVYSQAVKNFNAGSGKPKTDPAWLDLKGLLDEKVMATGIDTAVAYQGKDDVIDFLVAAQATFTHDVITQTLSYGANLATISGTADWQDNDGDSDGQILFQFEFVARSAANPKWKILRLTGTNPY